MQITNSLKSPTVFRNKDIEHLDATLANANLSRLFDESICSICHEMLNNHLTQRILHPENPIPHIFHEECVNPWLNVHNSCPLCRQNSEPPPQAEPNREDARELSFWFAAVSGDLVLVNALLANGQISEEDRGRAVRDAILTGQLEVVNPILANGQISEEHRGSAVRTATLRGHLEVVNALLANGQISEEHRSSAVRAAILRGHLEVVNALLANGQISEEVRGRAVTDAALRGHLEVVNALLANGQISEEDRSSAVTAAALRGHLEIVNALLANGQISRRAPRPSG